MIEFPSLDKSYPLISEEGIRHSLSFLFFKLSSLKPQDLYKRSFDPPAYMINFSRSFNLAKKHPLFFSKRRLLHNKSIDGVETIDDLE